MLKSLNRKIAILLWIIAFVYLIFSFNLPAYPYVPVDSDVLPIILGILLFLLAAILFFMKDEVVDKKKVNITQSDLFRLLSVLFLIVIYVILLEIVGFLIITILFIFFCSYLLGYQKHIINLLTSVLVPLTFYLLFTKLLQIKLPQGILSFF